MQMPHHSSTASRKKTCLSKSALMSCKDAGESTDWRDPIGGQSDKRHFQPHMTNLRVLKRCCELLKTSRQTNKQTS